MKKWLTITLVMATLTSAGVLATSLYKTPQPHDKQSQNVQTVESNPTPEELLKLINEERAKVNVSPLSVDPLLEKSAQRKADEMVANNNTEHLGKDGVRGAEYANQTGIMCKNVSENLISNNDRSRMKTAREAVQGWMSSDRHREALLNPKYSTTGFGINSWAVVEHFCEK